MKKWLVFVSIATSLMANTFDIKRNGEVVKYEYKKEDKTYTLSNTKFFEQNVKVIIEYSNKDKKQQIEEKYNLQNGKILYGELYIYEQSADDLPQFFQNLTSEDNIKNIYPNWVSIHKKY